MTYDAWREKNAPQIDKLGIDLTASQRHELSVLMGNAWVEGFYYGSDSLRWNFAASALAGSVEGVVGDCEFEPEEIAAGAFKIADACVAEMKKREAPEAPGV